MLKIAKFQITLQQTNQYVKFIIKYNFVDN